jgi:hypothetical protein
MVSSTKRDRVYDAAWDAIRQNDALERIRAKFSIHELRCVLDAAIPAVMRELEDDRWRAWSDGVPPEEVEVVGRLKRDGGFENRVRADRGCDTDSLAGPRDAMLCADCAPYLHGHATSSVADQRVLDATAVYWRTMWDVLLSTAKRTGHKRDPGESEIDFLQRIIRECRPDDHAAMNAYRRSQAAMEALERHSGNHPYEDG